jgi:hypothetical protein
MAYKYSGKKGQGMIDFMVNFFDATENKNTKLEKIATLRNRNRIKDTVVYVYKSKIHNKDGPIFTLEISKHTFKETEYTSIILLKDQSGNPISISNFEDYKNESGVFFPATSRLKHYTPVGDNKSILYVSNLDTAYTWPGSFKKFRIPKNCRVEKLN